MSQINDQCSKICDRAESHPSFVICLAPVGRTLLINEVSVLNEEGGGVPEPEVAGY